MKRFVVILSLTASLAATASLLPLSCSREESAPDATKQPPKPDPAALLADARTKARTRTSEAISLVEKAGPGADSIAFLVDMLKWEGDQSPLAKSQPARSQLFSLLGRWDDQRETIWAGIEPVMKTKAKSDPTIACEIARLGDKWGMRSDDFTAALVDIAVASNLYTAAACSMLSTRMNPAAERAIAEQIVFPMHSSMRNPIFYQILPDKPSRDLESFYIKVIQSRAGEIYAEKAVLALGQLGTQKAVQVLNSAYNAEASHDLKQMYRKGLMMIPDPQYRHMLKDGLNDRSFLVRHNSARALAMSALISDHQIITEHISQPNPAVREQIVAAAVRVAASPSGKRLKSLADSLAQKRAHHSAMRIYKALGDNAQSAEMEQRISTEKSRLLSDRLLTDCLGKKEADALRIYPAAKIVGESSSFVAGDTFFTKYGPHALAASDEKVRFYGGNGHGPYVRVALGKDAKATILTFKPGDKADDVYEVLGPCEDDRYTNALIYTLDIAGKKIQLRFWHDEAGTIVLIEAVSFPIDA